MNIQAPKLPPRKKPRQKPQLPMPKSSKIEGGINEARQRQSKLSKNQNKKTNYIQQKQLELLKNFSNNPDSFQATNHSFYKDFDNDWGEFNNPASGMRALKATRRIKK